MARRETLDPAVYARVFEGHHEGRLILEDLQAHFCTNLFVRGGEDGKRQTDYKLGRNAVVNFIMAKIGQAGGDEPDAEEDT